MAQRMYTLLILVETDRVLSRNDTTNAYSSDKVSFPFKPLAVAVINHLHFTNMLNKHDI